ncbi:hypothetical protein [Nonomuraea sp. NPDC049646]|uniref:hypothetical protein n=1 Tax=unclassified Nonomuraea TaxID=2593643 RepID=UPI00379EC6D5
MKVLGHSSVSMALVCVQVGDREVLRDYKSVLEPGAIVAGPAADELKSGTLPAEAVDWLKSNFLKTELELGHCLRLPAEGPCGCDLRGWTREVERHTAVARRLTGLLTGLGETTDPGDDNSSGRSSCMSTD